MGGERTGQWRELLLHAADAAETESAVGAARTAEGALRATMVKPRQFVNILSFRSEAEESAVCLSSDRSSHVGFVPSMSATFSSRRQSFNSFSRAMA